MNEHVAVVDLGYGDAGKGTVVDALCASAPVRAVLRFNGGAQAAHNVVTEDGRQHTFAQFGSGTLRGVPTHLTRFVVVDPLALAAEAAALGNPFELLTVDGDALLATPWHRAANRRRELARGGDRHGSCGMGVGETMAYALSHPDAPRVSDALSRPRLRRRLAALEASLGPAGVPLDDVVEAFLAFGRTVSIVDGSHGNRLLSEGPCVFEGAQGVLLDEWRGWHPHTTWSTTTFENVAALCGSFRRLGVVRTYTTRHGAGPFVTEDPALDLPEGHNATGEWQGPFRVGHFDAVAHRYAVEVAGGIDGLAVTHLDVPARSPSLRICSSYKPLAPLGAEPATDFLRGGEPTAHLPLRGAELTAHLPLRGAELTAHLPLRGAELTAHLPSRRTGPEARDVPLHPITRIVPGPARDLDHQAALTSLLNRAEPDNLSRPDDWAGAIGTLLDAPVLVESWGPSAADKKLSERL